jgi:hypothetical protein
MRPLKPTPNWEGERPNLRETGRKWDDLGATWRGRGRKSVQTEGYKMKIARIAENW